MKVLLVLFFLFYSLSASAEDIIKSQPYFFNCTKNTDCIIVDDGCGMGAVNKKYKKEGLFHLRETKDCVPAFPYPQMKDYKAYCLRKACMAKRRHGDQQ